MKTPRLAIPAIIALLFCTGSAVRAGILEDFRFGDDDGTLLGAAVNSAGTGHNWFVHANTVESEVQGGSFRINKQTATGQAANSLEIDNITSGKAWLVVDIAGWHYTEGASSPSERVRFAFLDNDDITAAGGSTVTAEMNIDRGGGALELKADALGSGAVVPTTAHALPLSLDEPLKIVLELDADADEFAVLYKHVGQPWGSLGIGSLGERSAGVLREGRSIRFAFTGTFGDEGEFFDISRIYLTDDPALIPEPSSVALACLSLGALLGWRRRG